MGALPTSEPVSIRYANYVAELHEFFGTSGIPYGSPDDLPLIVEKLQRPGTFADDLSSLIRSFMLRQGGSMPHAELLEILSTAIAGPDLALHPQDHASSLRQLLGFIAGVQRRPWNVPPNAPGEVLPFPSDAPMPIKRQSAPAPLPVEISEPTFAPSAVEPVIATETAARATDRERRNGLWAAGAVAAVLAVGVVVFARMHQPAETFKVQPAPSIPVQQSVGPQAGNTPPIVERAPDSVSQTAVPQPSATAGPAAKPSAYGDILAPGASRPVPRSPERVTPAVGNPYSVAGRTMINPPAPSAAVSSNSTTVFAPYNPPNGATTQPAAPIVRQPATIDPDGYIAGELPEGATAAPASSRITVSSGVMAANLLFAPVPGYPLLARIAHAQGRVTLLAVVAKDGTVEATRVLRGNRLLRAAAQDAVLQFRYRPYRIDGRPVEVATVVTVDFDDSAAPSDSQ